MPIDYYTGSPRRRRREGPIGLEQRCPIQPRKAPRAGSRGRQIIMVLAGAFSPARARTPLARESALERGRAPRCAAGGVPVVFWAEMGVGTLLDYGYPHVQLYDCCG